MSLERDESVMKQGPLAYLGTQAFSGDMFPLTKRSGFMTAFISLLCNTLHQYATADVHFIVQILDAQLVDCSKILFVALQAVLFLCSRLWYCTAINRPIFYE